MRSPDGLCIANGSLEARIRPDWGGRMTHLSHRQLGNILVPTQEDNFRPYDWPRAGAYPLAPYHNRLYGALFTQNGVTHELRPHPALAPDAIHGPAHRRPWMLADIGEDRATLRLHYEADDEWPFAFLAEQHFRIERERLIVDMAITNLSPATAPLGLGWHPYLAVPVTSFAQTDARLEYPLDALNVPTSDPARPRAGHDIPSATGYTLHFKDWSKASVKLNGGSLLIEADPVFDHLAVHRMERYLCLEPVSMAAGVLSMPEALREQNGLKLVEPGGSVSGRIVLSFSIEDDSNSDNADDVI